MKITNFALILSAIALAPTVALAQPPASTQQIVSLKAACIQIAQEDSIPDDEVGQFLLDCVNDQLTESGYQRVESIDGNAVPEATDEEHDAA